MRAEKLHKIKQARSQSFFNKVVFLNCKEVEFADNESAFEYRLNPSLTR